MYVYTDREQVRERSASPNRESGWNVGIVCTIL